MKHLTVDEQKLFYMALKDSVINKGSNMSNQERRNYEEDIHLYLGFFRKKYNGEVRPRCIRRIVKSERDLEILKKELELIGGYWRIHRTVNKRSTLKAFKKLQHYMLDNPDCHAYVDSVWKTILLQPESRAEKKFMIDVDTKNQKTISELESICGQLLEIKESPNGYHLVFNPFDVRLVEGIENVTVLKDGYIYVDEVGKVEEK